jgi:hypothetical protein
VKEAKAVVAVAEPVKPAETKAKKAVAKKGK